MGSKLVDGLDLVVLRMLWRTIAPEAYVKLGHLNHAANALDAILANAVEVDDEAIARETERRARIHDPLFGSIEVGAVGRAIAAVAERERAVLAVMHATMPVGFPGATREEAVVIVAGRERAKQKDKDDGG